MCVVSNIGDYYKQNFPISTQPWKEIKPWDFIPTQTDPGPRDPTPEEIKKWITMNKDWTVEKYEAFKKLIEEAKKLDALMGEADCEDPEKTRWINDLEELVIHLKVRIKKKPVKRKKR